MNNLFIYKVTKKVNLVHECIVVCFCRNVFTTTIEYIRHKTRTHCGCLTALNPYKVFKIDYIQRAKKRNILFELSDKTFFYLIKQNCFYCDAKPMLGRKNGNVKVNGIDRLDSSKGYIGGNVVSCCWICNRAKGNRTLLIFNNWIKNIILKYIFNIEKDILHYNEELVDKKIKLRYSYYKFDNISYDVLYKTITSKCHYCGIFDYIKLQGLDRINSNDIYRDNNILPCCTMCNLAKSNMLYDNFIKYLKNLAEINYIKSEDLKIEMMI